ncbi:MAG: OsmC family protein [Burkholderiaceae bacterium]
MNAATLATATAQSRLSNEPGRALLAARGQHLVCDSPPPLGGPNEAMNPVELLLAALAACGTFVCETVARELALPLTAVTVTAAGDFDPRGVCGEPVDPRLQGIRVHLALGGLDAPQREALAQAFRTRCPVFTTLASAAPLTLEVVDAV